ncbi:hypothetical protein [Paraliobacillus sp. X-1268]|uniref:hypothetical protein n=1 Tax=Paraliobacillus sp. X-1268 TaxID=2213193 RepID=UPI0018E5341B|nr:hypothetical protein [Paraliobacillus sp. X-1268]
MMGDYGGRMNGYGFGMMALGLLGCLISLIVIGLVVYYATKLALKHYHKDQQK